MKLIKTPTKDRIPSNMLVLNPMPCFDARINYGLGSMLAVRRKTDTGLFARGCLDLAEKEAKKDLLPEECRF